MPEEKRLEEQLLSQEAGKRLSDQLDHAEKIDVDVQTNLLKIFQGQVDGVYMSGQGLVIKGIRVQDLKLQTDGVAINPFSALFGKIRLNEPVNATIRLVLTEADINRALTSDIVRGQMPKFDLNVDGEIVSLQPQEIQIHLPEENHITSTGKVLLQEKDNTRPVFFAATLCPRTKQQPIILKGFNCTQGEGISLEIIVALIQKVKELVDSPYFEFEDMALRIKNMEVQKENLILLVEAHVRQISDIIQESK